MSDLKPHQQRVVDEKAELDGKLAKLQQFFSSLVFSGIDPDEKKRLRRQATVMTEYSGILGDRIAHFK